jgi:hypothetical protein
MSPSPRSSEKDPIQSALVVTSIAKIEEHQTLQSLARAAQRMGVPFILIGDTKTPPVPPGFLGVDFYSESDPRLSAFTFSSICPKSTYSRKNLGYLIASDLGARWIWETDDDNEPLESFWTNPEENVRGRQVSGQGWVNAYRAFTDEFIYPRGFSLSHARHPLTIGPEFSNLSPIQQSLVNGDPDVDAIYRLLFRLPFEFHPASPLLLSAGQWCPFNSQNTVIFRRAFPLLYLPTYCSFRMTDIWRSFVAQRILQANNYSLSFHAPTAIQHRNDHDLMVDFRDEVSGYLENGRIVESLSSLEVPAGDEKMPEAMKICYEEMVRREWLPRKEMVLLQSWLSDLSKTG